MYSWIEHCQFCRFATVSELSCALVPPMVMALQPAAALVSYTVPIDRGAR